MAATHTEAAVAMRMGAIRLLSALSMSILVPLAASACGDSTAPVRDVTGTWQGMATGSTFTLTLSENASGEVSGFGNVRDSGGSVALRITGTHADVSVSLTMSSSGFKDLEFSGTCVLPNTITGRLNGSGFNDNALTLTRTPT